MLLLAEQAEKAIAMKATREQMSLLVMEILYIWTIIPGCSEVDLRQMLEGLCWLKDGFHSMQHMQHNVFAYFCDFYAIDAGARKVCNKHYGRT